MEHSFILIWILVFVNEKLFRHFDEAFEDAAKTGKFSFMKNEPLIEKVIFIPTYILGTVQFVDTLFYDKINPTFIYVLVVNFFRAAYKIFIDDSEEILGFRIFAMFAYSMFLIGLIAAQ